MAMDIEAGRMVFLGYGKYWRSDHIVGLRPIEENRGPGRRTEVFVSGLSAPIVASRTERAILEEMMTGPDEAFRLEEARGALVDLVDALGELSPMLRRLLTNEGRFDVERWEERLQAVLHPAGDDEATRAQNELFA